ncbi:MAG TPA: porin family protein [Flavisolibacter sp.]|nr:porin family protein [Flavisolibacter sp.]
MKKQILLTLSLALSTFIFAQTKLGYGVKAGVTKAGLSGNAVNSFQSLLDFADGAFTTQSRSGFFGGAYVSIPVSNMFSIEPGLYYSQKGYGLKGSLSVKGAEFLSANATAQLNTTYIDLPVLAKVNMSGFQLFAGPQVSYLADAKLRTTAGALGFNVLDKTMNAKDQFNQWDIALTGGVGYQFSNGFNVSAAYDHGLSKVDNGQNFDSYNRTFKVGVGLTF